MRRGALFVASLLAALAFGCGTSSAQDSYPNRPIQIIVPFAPSGSIDVTFRILAPEMAKRLGQSVVVVNRPGGGATIGMNEVARAAPDGYTLGAASFAFAANSAVLASVPYDPLKDFEPITMVARSSMILVVNPKTPVSTTKEFIDWAKSQPPGSLNYGSVGIGSSGHLITELFLLRAGLKMTHVPFNNSPLPPLAQGLIQMQIGPIPSTIPWVRDGRLKVLGVTSLDKDPTVPDLTPVSTILPGFDTYEWPGLVAPAKTPKAIIDRIRQSVVDSLKDPDVVKKLFDLGSTPVGDTPEEFRAHIVKETATWADVAKQAGITPQQTEGTPK
jgi:tripartite-type tricarboxylate transporter receptor subunit TctC